MAKQAHFDILDANSDSGIDSKHAADACDFYTIGYEGRTLENFISRLQSFGIKQLVDVREKPISRKKGFSKNALRDRLESEGIHYIHMPELGSPSDIRHEYKAGGSEIRFFEMYREYVESNELPQIAILEGYVSDMPTAIMCFEQLHIHCHRKIIASMIVGMGHRVNHI